MVQCQFFCETGNTVTLPFASMVDVTKKRVVSTMAVSPSTTLSRPLLTLAVSLLCQAFAGTLYWFPAIAPGIAAKHGLSQTQSTFIVAVANSGTLFGMASGLFHNKFGSRTTATVSALGVSTCYFILATLTRTTASVNPKLLYSLILVVVLALIAFSFGLYSSSMTAAASSFPVRYRGRVVGLNATIYGGSAGIQSAFQAAFFHDVSQISSNLYFTSFLMLIIAIGPIIAYPRGKPDPSSVSLAEQLAPLTTEGSSACAKHISGRLTYAYRMCVCFLLALQFAALSDFLQLSTFVRQLAVCTLIGVLISFLSMATGSRLKVSSSIVAGSQEQNPAGATAEREPNIFQVMRDPRALFLTGGFLFLVGGGGVALLIQSPFLIASLQHGPYAIWKSFETNAIVRAIVTTFAACSVAGRLLTGSVMDRVEDANARVMWIYSILRTDFLLMGFALLSLIVPSKAVIVLGVVTIGLVYGSFFSTAPALATLWFGVNNFALNFATFGSLQVIASAIMDSAIPMWLRSRFGTWVEVSYDDGKVDRVCAGIACRMPTFTMLASFLFTMYIIGGFLKERVRREGYLNGRRSEDV